MWFPLLLEGIRFHLRGAAAISNPWNSISFSISRAALQSTFPPAGLRRSPMELLERKTHLDELGGMLRQAAGGRGLLVFLGGEAGVGKSSLLRAFAAQVQSTACVLTGYCDSLSTPRPLGPLLDISEQIGAETAAFFGGDIARSDVFAAFAQYLGANPVSLVIIEDAHWADEATLDLLRFLGRRIGAIPALIVVTYRDDEIDAGHPLRQVLGDLATAAHVRRLGLMPLSRASVTQLAQGTRVDSDELFRLTGGNPFFVTEILSVDEQGLPSTVRDAVLARASRLPVPARQALEACAVIGAHIEPWLLQLVTPQSGSAAECVGAGILTASGPDLAFRHELARQAILESIDPVSRMDWHRRVLETLKTRPAADPARLAHHAEESGNAEAVLAFATLAAERASTLGAHREAAAQYARNLRFADALTSRQRGELLQAHSYECYLTNQLPAALASAEAALSIWRQEGDREKEVEVLIRLSRLAWVLGRTSEARARNREALETLDELGDIPLRAVAYSNQAQLHSLAWETDEAIAWGERAIALAGQFGDVSTRIQALTNVGSARFAVDGERGRRDLEQCLAWALERGMDDHAARAYVLLARNHAEIYQFAQADQYLDEGIRFCTERDLDYMRLYLQAWKATTLLYQGRWSEAESLIRQALPHTRDFPVTRIIALSALGRIQTRKGHPDAASTLEEALELATPSGDLLWIGPVRAGRAEASWLAGDMAGTEAEAAAVYDEAVDRKRYCLAGELSLWRWRAGAMSTPALDRIFDPFALQIRGLPKEAASRWRALGCPYEAASALAESNDEADLRYALAEFDRLGAAPMAEIVSANLREMTRRRIRHRAPLAAAVAKAPETRYARSDDVHIAYQVLGDGPIDLVFVMGWVSNVEKFWEGPSAPFLRRLASFSRLITFDKRGTGLSDRVVGLPTLEERMDDVRAVMEAAGSKRAALIGISEGAPMCALFAATYPERTSALVIYGGFARRLWAQDYPWAPTRVEREALIEVIEREWGGPVGLQSRAPSVASDEEFQRWWAAFLRSSASPGAAMALSRMNSEIDVRHVLPAIQAPTLVVHRTDDQLINVASARFLAEQIPNARYVELPGIDHLPFAGDQDAILDEVELFLTGVRPVPQANRVLATLVVVEIDADGGPEYPTAAHERHTRIEDLNQVIDAELERFRGERLPDPGTTVRAAFDGPGRAIRFACVAVDAAQQLGMRARAGLHTGECERSDGLLTGPPLDLAAEIAVAASPGGVVLSSLVKDLVAGSGINFSQAGKVIAAAFPGGLTLYSVVREAHTGGGASRKTSARIEMNSSIPAQLSRRETEIAILIAGGLSNRQIAEELSISPATVERHVANIFNKLGFHSRTQIAAWAVEQRLGT